MCRCDVIPPVAVRFHCCHGVWLRLEPCVLVAYVLMEKSDLTLPEVSLHAVSVPVSQLTIVREHFSRSLWRTLWTQLRRQSLPIREDEYPQKLKHASRYCSVQSGTAFQIHSLKLDGYKQLKCIAVNLDAEGLRKLNIESLMWSAFSLFVYFKLRLRGRGFSECLRRRQFDNVNALCGLIINKLIPGMEWEVVRSAISFANHFRLWSQEFLAFAVLYKPLSLGVPGYVVLTLMLDQVEELVHRNSMESRQVMRILYEVMSTYEWPPQGEKGIEAITRLLRLFYTAACDHRLPCAVLRKGLEVCTFRVLEHMTPSDVRKVMPEVMQGLFDPKLSDSALLDIANVIEHATLFHSQGPYSEIIGDQLFISVLNMVASKRRVLSLVGNRFLQLMVDRNQNRHQFETPKIFFQNTHFNIKIGRYNPDDMVFLKHHRELFHNSFLKCVLRHAEHRLSLETTYMSICIIACEVPCSFTAAATVCLVINMQEVVRHYPTMKPEVMFHLHATVIAVISLICWIYNAPDLYSHMNKVMKYRADFAPHLNPPLQNHYIFAQHHVTTEKPEFFFEDWEVRYGLWKCFKIKDGREHRESFKEECKKHISVAKSAPAKKTKATSKEQLLALSNEGDLFYVNGD